MLCFSVSPEDHMYVVLNRFLLSHQNLDMKRVPEFFKMFLGYELEVKYYIKESIKHFVFVLSC